MKYRFIPDLNRQDDLFSELSLNIYGLTPNQIYEVISIESKKIGHNKTTKTFLKLINDRREEVSFNSDWFISIDIEREVKLTQIGL
jgi:hypothetical protein